MKLVPDTATDVPLGPDFGDSVIPATTVNGDDGLFVPSVALTVVVTDNDAGTVNFTPLKPPVLLVVTVAGTVGSAVVPNLNVTVCDGTRKLPDASTDLPTMLLVVLSTIVGVVPTVNVAAGLFVPSDAVTVFDAPADAGTVNVLVKVPVALVVAVTVGLNSTPLNLSVTVLVGKKLVPDTVTV